MTTLRSERLTLRPYTLDDVDFVFDMYSRWEVQQFLGRTPQVSTERADAIARIERWSAIDDPIRGFWLAVDTDSGKRLGTLLLTDLPLSGNGGPSGEIEIGWHLHPNAWGLGVATEAATAVLDHAFDGGLERVLAVVKPDNIASQRVAERLGMKHLGITTDYYDSECVLYRIDRG